MKVVIDLELCDRCGCCVSICPTLALNLTQYNLVIDHDKCILCRKCLKSCPLGALKIDE